MDQLICGGASSALQEHTRPPENRLNWQSAIALQPTDSSCCPTSRALQVYAGVLVPLVTFGLPLLGLRRAGPKVRFAGRVLYERLCWSACYGRFAGMRAWRALPCSRLSCPRLVSAHSPALLPDCMVVCAGGGEQPEHGQRPAEQQEEEEQEELRNNSLGPPSGKAQSGCCLLCCLLGRQGGRRPAPKLQPATHHHSAMLRSAQLPTACPSTALGSFINSSCVWPFAVRVRLPLIASLCCHNATAPARPPEGSHWTTAHVLEQQASSCLWFTVSLLYRPDIEAGSRRQQGGASLIARQHRPRQSGYHASDLRLAIKQASAQGPLARSPLLPSCDPTTAAA